MKKKLMEVKKNVSLKEVGQSLSKADLQFITGGTSLLSGAGSSSTSGNICCDGTCLCKPGASLKA
jgi:hypothetical protein